MSSSSNTNSPTSSVQVDLTTFTDTNNEAQGQSTCRPSTPTSDRSTPPPIVESGTKSGVEPQAFELAKMFMAKMGNLARKCRTRGQLSELYLSTIASWATEEVQKDTDNQRHFKQVLFAIAHGMKLVRVRDEGRTLFWNKYRDNHGNQIDEERDKFDQRRQESTSSDGWHTAGPRRGYQGDRRAGGGHQQGGYQGDRVLGQEHQDGSVTISANTSRRNYE